MTHTGPTRRQFLGALFGVAVAAVMVQKLEALGVSADVANSIWSEELNELTAAEAWRLFQEISAAKGHVFDTRLDRVYHIGDVLESGYAARHFAGIDILGLSGGPIALRGPMTQLVQHGIEKGLGTYVRLELPPNQIISSASGPMRFVRFWDPVASRMGNRFDLCGAVTDANQRRSWVLRGERTKARLLFARAKPRLREGLQYADWERRLTTTTTFKL